MPPGADYAVVVFSTSNGRFDFGSGLTRLRDGELVLRVESSSNPTAELGVLVGFDEASIRRLDPPTDVELERDPLSEATACDPRLPEPVWSVALSSGAPEPSAGAFTTDWLSSSCPQLLPEGERGLVDLCGDLICSPWAEQRGCELHIGIRQCGPVGVPDFSATLDRAGRTCTTAPACEALETAPGAAASFLCQGNLSCPIHIYGGRETLDLVFDKAAVLDRPLLEREFGKGIAPSDWLTGYLGSIAHLADRVVISGHVDAGYRRTDFAARAPTLLAFLDPETMQVTSTRTATESGLLHISKDRFGDGFVGVFHQADDLAIGRFSADGERIAAVPFGVGRDHSPFGLTALPAQSAFVSFTGSLPDRTRVQIGMFDAQTLAVRGLCELHEPLRPIDVVALDDGRIAVSDDDGDKVAWIDPMTCEISTFASPGAGAFGLGFLYPGRAPGELIVTTDAGNSRGLHRIAPGRFPIRGAQFVGAPSGTAAVGLLVPHPGDRFRQLVAGIADPLGQRQATLAEFLIEDTPRVLPRTLEVGVGPLTAPSIDAKGRLWMLLPWSAEVVRLAPR